MRNKGYMGMLSGLLGLGMVSCDAQVDGDYQGEPLTRLEGRVLALSAVSEEIDVGVLWFTSSSDAECSGPVQSCVSSATSQGSVDVDPECLAACGQAPGCDGTDQAEEWVECQHACGVSAQLFLDVHYTVCASSAVGERTPVVGDFPAQFSLDMLGPPPSAAIMASDTGERAALGWLIAADQSATDLNVNFAANSPPSWLVGGSETHVLIYAEDVISEDSTWGRYLGGAYAEGYHLVQVEFGNRCGLPTPDPNEVQNNANVPNVCGNGVCEGRETCDNCSDCVECDADSQGNDSGLTNLDEGYMCVGSSSRLVKGTDDEQDVELKLAPPGRIDWPTL